MTEREAYIALNMMAGIGPVSVRSLVSAFGSAQAIWTADKSALTSVRGVGSELAQKIMDQRDRLDPVREEQDAVRRGYRVLTPLDPDYPVRLKEIHDPPLALYLWGTLEQKDRHSVAVVGSRRTTHYGLEVAERLSYQLVQAGFTVVSGLARGIDTAAHRGALKAGGRTVAVLGGGLDRIYPPENAELARAISGQGGVLSEFPIGREPDKTTFPIRNRIISGLSMGILVVEAGLDSGAIITAHQGLEQGRTVFAVPGRIDSPASRGCHDLIKHGAKLVEGVDDILEEFSLLMPRGAERPAGAPPSGGEPASRPAPDLSEDERALVRALGEEEALDIDSLTRMSRLKPANVSSALVGLEMKKMVRMRPGRIVELVR